MDFWSNVLMGNSDECWPWLRCTHKNGYGALSFRKKTFYAHRVAYILLKGEIPEGLQIDHLCRNRACCNPAHLEAVTQKENVLRGVSPPAQNARRGKCPAGHEYSPTNTHTGKNGRRHCLECEKKQQMIRYHIKKLTALGVKVSVI